MLSRTLYAESSCFRFFSVSGSLWEVYTTSPYYRLLGVRGSHKHDAHSHICVKGAGNGWLCFMQSGLGSSKLLFWVPAGQNLGFPAAWEASYCTNRLDCFKHLWEIHPIHLAILGSTCMFPSLASLHIAGTGKHQSSAESSPLHVKFHERHTHADQSSNWGAHRGHRCGKSTSVMLSLKG